MNTEKPFGNHVMVILAVIIPIAFLIVPSQTMAYRTSTGCGDGNDYDTFKEGVDKAKSYLDDEWSWTTNGRAISHGHYDEKAMDDDYFVSVFYDRYQSPLFVTGAHGADAEGIYGGQIGLYSTTYMNGDDFDDDVAEGNWGTGIAGTVWYCGSCHLGNDNLLCEKAKNAGCRTVCGYQDSDVDVKTKFVKYHMKNYAKKLADDSAYTVKQVNKKSYDSAKDDTPIYQIYNGYPGYICYHWGSSGSNADTLYNIPRKDYDFDNAGTVTTVSTLSTSTVGGDASGAIGGSDDGAIYFLNCYVTNNNDRIKVEYKSSSQSSWVQKGIYALTKDVTISGVSINSEKIVIRFSDDEVSASYLQVRITPLDNGITVYSNRILILTE